MPIKRTKVTLFFQTHTKNREKNASICYFSTLFYYMTHLWSLSYQREFWL